MRIVGQRIEKKIRQPMARQMVGKRQPVGEHEARRIDAARCGSRPQIGGRWAFARNSHSTLPAISARSRIQTSKTSRRDLVAVVEAAEHEAFRGQACLARVRCPRGDGRVEIVDLVAVGKMDDLLGVERLPVDGSRTVAIGEDVVEESAPSVPG